LKVHLACRPFASRKLAGVLLLAAALTPTAAISRIEHREARSYFVEFRARPSGDAGHSVVVYGRLDQRGRPVPVGYASFWPSVDGRWGMILPIEGDVRATLDDIHAQPISVYRRELTAAQYARVQQTVRRAKAQYRLWHAFFFNCNDLLGEVAGALGLIRPPSFLAPNLWVDTLRSLNGP
jgi:hypothetical protein